MMMNKFEQGDMDWLKNIIEPDKDKEYWVSDVMLSHGRTERIINRIEELEAQVDRLTNEANQARQDRVNAQLDYAKLQAQVDHARYEAIGWTMAYCCALLEGGDDPRSHDVVALIEKAQEHLTGIKESEDEQV